MNIRTGEKTRCRKLTAREAGSHWFARDARLDSRSPRPARSDDWLCPIDCTVVAIYKRARIVRHSAICIGSTPGNALVYVPLWIRTSVSIMIVLVAWLYTCFVYCKCISNAHKTTLRVLISFPGIKNSMTWYVNRSVCYIFFMTCCLFNIKQRETTYWTQMLVSFTIIALYFYTQTFFIISHVVLKQYTMR